MNVSWSVLALALMGAEDQQPSQPKSPSPSFAIEIDISGSGSVASEPCCKAAVIAVKPDVDTATATVAKPGIMSKLVDYCIKRCVDLAVDEVKAAIVAKLTEDQASAPKPAACTEKAEHGEPLACADELSSTLPMKLPKVSKTRTTSDPEAAEAWPMTLREAILIGLDNTEIVRVIAFGAQRSPISGFEPTPLKTETPAKEVKADSSPIVIARVNADATVWRFKAEITAHVRSVEQSYWSLAQAHVQLWAADRAVTLAKEVLKREEAELVVGRGTPADIAEISQRLEQLNLDLVTRTSDVITTERQLRNLLGLPPSDNRRIIPVTPPTGQRIEYDWDTCLQEMMENQPDIAQQKVLVRVAELQLLIARNLLLPPFSLNAIYQFNGLGRQLDTAYAVMTGTTLKALDPVISDLEKAVETKGKIGEAESFLNWQTGYTYQMPIFSRSPLANSRQAQYILLRSRAYLQQVVHQTTHSLARFFLEIDANYKQYKTATRLRTAAAQRMDAQRAYYEEGRITIDRYMDAISQYATAVATEAQYQATYNIALAALAEAKGTLLAERNIMIAESRRAVKPYVKSSKPQGPAPPPPPPLAIAAVLGQSAMTVPVDPNTTARPSRWKGTRDLMTVAAAFAADLPQDVEVPRVGVFAMPPASSVDDASCCDAGSGVAGPITKSETSCTTAMSVAACTVTKAETSGTTSESKAPARPKTWSFSISIGGANPLQIKGTITEGEADHPAAAKP